MGCFSKAYDGFSLKSFNCKLYLTLCINRRGLCIGRKVRHLVSFGLNKLWEQYLVVFVVIVVVVGGGDSGVKMA